MKIEDDDDENGPQPHKRPQRPTVTSPGWILHSRSVGWNLSDGGEDMLCHLAAHLADLEGCDGRGGAG